MRLTLRNKFTAGGAVGVVVLATLVSAQTPARATIACTFSGSTAAIVVNQPNEAITIARRASGEIEFDAANGVTCGPATVTNTDKITVTGALGRQAVRIDLSNGGFVPGATAEGTGASEIEFEINLGTGGETSAIFDILSISGTNAAETFHLGSLGINVNGDNDPDITGPSSGPTTTTGTEQFEISGQGGADVISGAANADTGAALPLTFTTLLGGGNGADQLTGGDSADTLIGGAGNDTENGGAGVDVFDEEAAPNGDDDFVGGLSPYDEIDYSKRTTGVTFDLDGVADDGQPGAELDNVHPDIEYALGGSGDDTIADNSATFTARTFWGGPGNDTITGGPSGDNIFGESGNDTLHGGTQGDYLYGGDGDDQVFGDAGLDTLWEDQDVNGPTVQGPNGADDLFGGADADTVSYNVRNTALVVTADDNIANDGADTNPGGPAEEGDNVHDDVESIIGASYGPNRLTGNALANGLSGGAFVDTINGLAGADNLVGDPGNDVISGGPDNDTENGGDGNDQLAGDAGDDTINGSFDNDTLDGGIGNDNEVGASGNDTFLQGSTANGNDTLDGRST